MNTRQRFTRSALALLRLLKAAGLAGAARSGVSAVVRATPWRRRRLLILCWHSIALADENRWNPQLYMSLDHLRTRLKIIKTGGYKVLPLSEALEMVVEDRLPPKALVLTFDDGTVDFPRRAWPLLREFGFPATVYISTYYAERRYPVFNVAMRYAEWATGRSIRPLPERELNGLEKHELAKGLAAEIGFDYTGLCRRELFHIMRPEEVHQLAIEGCDIQLHTHRHRSPLEEGAFRREVAENRARIRAWTGTVPRHFCYPSGEFRGRFQDWLRKEGVHSAVTTQPGMVTAQTNALLAPRLVDTEVLPQVVFRGWLDGVAGLLPTRRQWRDPDHGIVFPLLSSNLKTPDAIDPSV